MLKTALLLGIATNVSAGQPSLTIYNGGFATVRDSLTLDLHPGLNRVSHTGITRHLEPDSVMLRDPAGKVDLSILEQNYIGDPLTQDRLLERFEGKTLSFELADKKVVEAKLIRAPYNIHAAAMGLYGSNYYATQMAQLQGAGSQPMVEMDGKLQFALPGKPLFPPLDDGETLKPTLSWVLDAKTGGKVPAELSYVTGGMTWKADYNISGPEKGDRVDLVGWVTMDNNSGKGFDNARINLMAGDVNKVRSGDVTMAGVSFASFGFDASKRQAVVQKPFDEFHLYSLPRPVSLSDRETKQVEFLRASGVRAKVVYVYDGVSIDQNYASWNFEMIRNQREYGSRSNPKVWVMREVQNERSNGLGVPLPEGRVRFYRQDGAQLEFVGENTIDHTPEGETLRIFTGDSFDLVGERRRTQFNTDSQKWTDESFEIRLRNRKKEAVDIRVVEHLYRGLNWEITQKSDSFEKKDGNTIEFRIVAAPGEEKVLTYAVHYTW